MEFPHIYLILIDANTHIHRTFLFEKGFPPIFSRMCYFWYLFNFQMRYVIHVKIGGISRIQLAIYIYIYIKFEPKTFASFNIISKISIDSFVISVGFKYRSLISIEQNGTHPLKKIELWRIRTEKFLLLINQLIKKTKYSQIMCHHYKSVMKTKCYHTMRIFKHGCHANFHWK